MALEGVEGDSPQEAGAGAPGRQARRVLLACCATHLVTDGLNSAIYPLLPLIALDLQLSYTAVGSLRTALIASTSTLQIPVGYLADWIPEITLLGAGMLWMSVGFAAMALAGSFLQLLLLIVGAGIGGNVQHPIATAIVSRVYEGGGRGTAVSSLNFAGDLGKVILPTMAGVIALMYGWRGALLALGVLGVAASLSYFLAVGRASGSNERQRSSGEKMRGWGIQKPFAFTLLTAIGIIDNSTRVGVLTFLPFLMTDKGLDAARVSFLLTLLFASGAAGKLGCGFLADRFGNVGVIVITEAITALAILAAIPVDPLMLIPVVFALGFVGNGTSSALYSAVAEMVHVETRAKGYGLFYTLTLGVGVLAPLLCGALADATGVPSSFVAMSLITLATLPMAVAMGRRG
ncbi:MAG: MFS transporter [Chloroflexota bacterium]